MSKVLPVKRHELLDRFGNGTRLVVKVVVRGSLDDEQILFAANAPVDLLPVRHRAERARHRACDDLDRLREQLLHQMEGIEGDAAADAGEAELVGGARILAFDVPPLRKLQRAGLAQPEPAPVTTNKLSTVDGGVGCRTSGDIER